MNDTTKLPSSEKWPNPFEGGPWQDQWAEQDNHFFIDGPYGEGNTVYAYYGVKGGANIGIGQTYANDLDGSHVSREWLKRLVEAANRSTTQQSKDVPANNRDAAMTPPILGGDRGAEPSSIPAQQTSLPAEAGASGESIQKPSVSTEIGTSKQIVQAQPQDYGFADEWIEVAPFKPYYPNGGEDGPLFDYDQMRAAYNAGRASLQANGEQGDYVDVMLDGHYKDGSIVSAGIVGLHLVKGVTIKSLSNLYDLVNGLEFEVPAEGHDQDIYRFPLTWNHEDGFSLETGVIRGRD